MPLPFVLSISRSARSTNCDRTGILLAASSISASFLGSQTIEHENGLTVLGGLALTALAVSVALAIYVLLTKEGFVFSGQAPVLYESLFEYQDDEGELKRRLSCWLETYRRSNPDKIEELDHYFFAAAVALVAQLVFWSFALASNIS